MILSWDKPEKVMTHEEWASISADGAPPGVYFPNMSEADMDKWKAKLIKGEFSRVEIRKSAHGTQMLIIVSMTGTPIEKQWARGNTKLPALHDVNVKMSMNGPSMFTFEEINQLPLAVQEARKVLEKL